jgi:hypothetical protein
MGISGQAVVDTRALYRMPWTMADNGFSWLEPTRECNMRCEYCYQRNLSGSAKPLEEIEHELEVLFRLRRADTLLIAGGEPLTHPQIVDVVRLARRYCSKPALLTNGAALTPALTRELKAAGAVGLVFHVDAGQQRPGWMGANEAQLNALRQEFADLSARCGLVCGYNTTILPSTLAQVPDIVRWTFTNIDKVLVNVLIPVRGACAQDPWDYYAGAERLNIEATPYATKHYAALGARDICEQVWKVEPAYAFHSYLGGTVRADVPKWLFGTHLGTRAGPVGYLGPRAAEILQSASHLARGRFLGFTTRGLNRWAAGLLLALAPVDRGLRGLALRVLRRVLLRPWSALQPLRLQNLVVMQPHDVLANGEQDECDGCPNKTYWNGRLVSECRKEDYLLFGRPLTALPKPTAAAAAF